MNARIEYAIAKLACEAMVINSGPRGLRAVSIRPFNVVGPRQSRAGGFVLPTFVQQALGNRPITVFATGRQRRSFLAIDDFVRAVRQVTAEPLRGADRRINVGNSANTISIEELAGRVRALLGSSSPIIHVDARTVYGEAYFEAESVDKLCDASFAARLGWKPRDNLDHIILATAEYFRSHRDVRGSDARD
jgi:nucleoside-diphosphate-sugar epimerase